jgi:hypothetical protein
MKLFERLNITGAGSAAAVTLHEYLSNRSVALLLPPRPGSLRDIGSGVCVQIGNLHFVATVAHNVRRLERSDIEVIPAGDRSAEPLRVQRIGWRVLLEGVDVDVAWLELDPEECKKSRIRFHKLDELKPLACEEEVHACFLQGYPAATVEVPTRPGERLLVESDGFLTLSIPASLRRGTHRPSIDIAVEYPPHDGSLGEKGLPPPPGVSGGGLWLFPRLDDHVVWAPGRAPLAGLGRGWWKSYKEFVATRIERWLDLVANDHPAVRAEVDAFLSANEPLSTASQPTPKARRG